MAAELASIIDFIRYGASRFAAAGLCFGHNHDNALDEATHLVLHALHLPHDIGPAYGAARLTAEEKTHVLALFERRVVERVPAAYLTGEAWFAGLAFLSDGRALVPRSPIAELVEADFAPWLDPARVATVLDLCTGSGCIALAIAHRHPDWQVTGADLSGEALALAEENRARLGCRNVRFVESDLFAALAGEHFDLIVSNPPYVTDEETDALPAEYRYEPELGLRAGRDGLDVVLRILAAAPDHLVPGGLVVCEVGESERALEALLPDVGWSWVEFRVGPMGVFVVSREQLLEHRERIRQLVDGR